jgi:hypothetical protein
MTYRTLILAAASIAAIHAAPAQADYTDPRTCHRAEIVQYEDDFCWDWTRDGNGSRGVVVKGEQTVRIVGPCGFRRLLGRIDWKQTDHVRGDGFAAKHGCKAAGRKA